MRINSIPSYYGHLGMAQRQKSVPKNNNNSIQQSTPVQSTPSNQMQNVSFGMFYPWNVKTDDPQWTAERVRVAFLQAYGGIEAEDFDFASYFGKEDQIFHNEDSPYRHEPSQEEQYFEHCSPFIDVARSMSIYVTISPYQNTWNRIAHKNELGNRVITVEFHEDGLEPSLSPERRKEALMIAKELGFEKDPETGEYSKVQFFARDTYQIQRLVYMVNALYSYEKIDTAGTDYPGLGNRRLAKFDSSV